MQTPLSVYQDNIQKFQGELQKVKKQLFISSMVRLAIFLVFGFFVYQFFGNTKLVFLFIGLGIASFLFLVSRHSNLQQKKNKLKELISINETEIEVLNRNFHHLPNGKEFTNPLHHFSQDIDLFGERSFFQYLNRTALASGKKKLAGLLTENHILHIEKKQNAIQELAEKIEFRQSFSAVAKLVKTETSSKAIINWLKSYQMFVPKVFKWLPKVFTALTALIAILYAFDLISGWFLGGWFVLGWLVVGRFSKKVNQLSNYLGQVQSTFHQYHFLLNLVEKETFTTELNQNTQLRIHTEKNKASELMKDFSEKIDGLEKKNFMIFGQVLSGFLLWDLWKAYELEQWISLHADRVENWFETINYFDAYNSLGNFGFNHPNYVFPLIKNNDTVLETTKAVHPLINSKEAVTNDYKIQQEQFFIITGANMAGKSTFLRTVSLQIVMANIGLPVCAETCNYSPIKLITSMRTVDSLADEASYFFSELTRLKFIVDEIKTDRYFIILDEILKGTNSTDKAIGSRKFIEKLVGSHSTGIIATHDLSLCEVAEELPQVKNHYFDAEIIDNELHFDYQFKNGICQNMNASFLLRKMEIVDS